MTIMEALLSHSGLPATRHDASFDKDTTAGLSLWLRFNVDEELEPALWQELDDFARVIYAVRRGKVDVFVSA